MEFRETSCCAVTDIHNLRHYENPHEAMLKFCRMVGWGRENPYCHTPRILSGFYMFTGVVQYEDYTKKIDPTYGPDFAQFIRDHNLGPLTETEPFSNRRIHPTHILKVWVWHPDQEKMEAWWAENREDKKELVKEKSEELPFGSGGSSKASYSLMPANRHAYYDYVLNNQEALKSLHTLHKDKQERETIITYSYDINT
jgi:hypothetical protein